MNLLAKANRRTSVAKATLLISAAFMASRLLGLIRDRLLATHFGLGAQMDAYTAAFRIPELLFTLLVSGAFAVAFIPVITEHLVKEERDEAWDLTSSLLNILVIGTVVLAVVLWIFASPLTTLVTPGFDPYRHNLTVQLTRIMLATPVLFAISSVLGSVQQAFHRFVIFSLASMFYNIGIIFGILYLSPTHSIYGVAYGVVIGAALQAILQVFGMFGLGYKYSFKIRARMSSVHRVLVLMVPRSIDQGLDQINYLIETIIGSRLVTGSLTAYYYANNLKNVPMALIGTAITTATFPQMTENAARGQTDQLTGVFVRTFRWILFLTLPAAVMAVLLRGYIVRLLFGFGSSVTADTLGWFAGVIIFQSLFFLVARVYYAMQDTKTPLMTSLASIVINTGFSFWLSGIYGVKGLAMADSIAAAFETILLLIILKRRRGTLGGKQLWSGVIRMSLAAAGSAAVLYVFVRWIIPLFAQDRGFAIVGAHTIELMAVGSVAYMIFCRLFKVRELDFLGTRMRDMMARSLRSN